jgi:hypothetical protein
LIPLAFFFVTAPAFGESLSNATGLAERLDIQTEGYIFEVKTVSNFDVTDHEFNKDEKRLTIFFNSGLENNLSEIIIPQNLLGGNFTFYLNDQEFFPKIKSNEKISFITLNFTGSGNNKLDIFGTTYLDGLIETVPSISDLTPSVDYDYGLIYALILVIVIIVGGVIGVIVFVVRKK